MSDLKYKVIKSEEQYYEYCKIHKELVFSDNSEGKQDEIELLGLLIKDWDDKHKLGPELDPIELVKSLMEDHGVNQTELAEIVDYSKNYISEILNYKKRVPPKMVRRLADHFKIQQSALNKPYRLEGENTDQTKVSKVSKLFLVEHGNKVSYDDSDESPMYVPSQGNLEYAKAN